MNYQSKCPGCGHIITAYTAPFNRGLARAFLKFADAALRNNGPVDKSTMALTNSEYGNFQKLRYFGLIQQEAKAAGWYFTERGVRFLNGEITILSPAGHFANEILHDDHLAWSTHTGKRTLVSLAMLLPVEWKQRVDYIAEKRGEA